VPAPGGEQRAFQRGVRIAAGFVVIVVAAIMIVIVNRDHPLKWQPHSGNQGGVENGPAEGTSGSPATSGLLAHPPKSPSDLGAR
jgi:hypothetical protein